MNSSIDSTSLHIKPELEFRDLRFDFDQTALQAKVTAPTVLESELTGYGTLQTLTFSGSSPNPDHLVFSLKRDDGAHIVALLDGHNAPVSATTGPTQFKNPWDEALVSGAQLVTQTVESEIRTYVAIKPETTPFYLFELIKHTSLQLQVTLKQSGFNLAKNTDLPGCSGAILLLKPNRFEYATWGNVRMLTEQDNPRQHVKLSKDQTEQFESSLQREFSALKAECGTDYAQLWSRFAPLYIESSKAQINNRCGDFGYALLNGQPQFYDQWSYGSIEQSVTRKIALLSSTILPSFENSPQTDGGARLVAQALHPSGLPGLLRYSHRLSPFADGPASFAELEASGALISLKRP